MTAETVNSDMFRKLLPSEKHRRPPEWCTICHSREDPGASELNRTLRQGMQHMWQSEILCDYTIIAGGRHFKVHKSFLVAVSDVLMAMLTVNMQESQRDYVELKAVTATGMQALLEFIYIGHMTLNEDNIDDVVAAASHLQIRAALTECSIYLRKSLNFNNAVDVYNIAKTFGLTNDLLSVAFETIVEGFYPVVRNDHYLKLDKRDFFRVLNSDKLNFGPEEKLFQCIIKWAEHDPTNRTAEAPDLLDRLRLYTVPSKVLESIIAPSEFFKGNETFEKLLKEARHYHQQPLRDRIMRLSFKDKIRNEPVVISFGGLVNDQEENYHCYALEETDWSQLPDMKNHFRGGAVTVVNNFLIACGGIVGATEVSNVCHVFDPRTFTWDKLPPMIDNRGHFPLVYDNAFLYAFGGCSERIDAVPHFINTKAIERYDFMENKWESVGNLANALRKHSACALGGEIYISGGIDEMYMSTSRLRRYNPRNETWTDCAEMNNVRFGHCMVPMKERIFLADPMNREIEYYQPSSDQWTKVRITFTQLPEFSLVAPNENMFYFINGKKDRGFEQGEEDRVCMQVFPVGIRTATCIEVAPYPEFIKDPVCCSLKLPWDVIFRAKYVSTTD